MSARKTISSSLNVNTIEDGESPIIVDIDNEMGSVACNPDGYVVDEQSVTTRAYIYKGTASQTITGIACYVDGTLLTSSYQQEGAGAFWKASVSNNVVTVTVKDETFLVSEDVEIRITSTIDGASVTKSAILTVAGIPAGADGTPAVIYSLLPNVNAVHIDKSGTITPTKISCKVLKTTGTSASEYTPSVGELKMGFDNNPESMAINYTSAQTIYATMNSIQFYFKKNGTGATLDKESIPVLKDGDDNVTYRSKWVQDSKEITNLLAQADGTLKTPTASKAITVSLMKQVGGNTEAVAHGTGTLTLHVGAASYSHTFTDANFTYTLQMTGSSESAEKNATNFRAVWVLDSTTYEHTINKVYDGADGSDSVSYQIIVDSVSAIVNAGEFELSLVCHCLKSVGSTRSTATDGSMTAYVGSALIGTSISWDSTTEGTYTKSNYTDDWETMGSPTSVVISYWISSNTVATLSVPITVKGDMGRNPYYLGEWSDSSDPDFIASTTHVVATDTQTPFVKITKQDGSVVKKVWSGGAIDKQKSAMSGDSNIESPTNTDSPYWEMMNESFNYLITKASFSEFAKLGSAIFNKDYMFSQWLVKYNASTGNYDSTNDYTKFSPDFVDDSVKDLGGLAPITNVGWRAAVLYMSQTCVYSFEIKGRRLSGSGSMTVTIGRIDTTSATTLATFSGTYETKVVSFTATASAKYAIRANTSNSSTTGEVSYIKVSCRYPYTPAIMMNWYNGYAHFACGNIKLNNDGSGELAGGKIRWNTQGDLKMRNALIGGFIYNEPNVAPVVNRYFNEITRSDYMNAYLMGNASNPKGLYDPTPVNTLTVEFPLCGSNINVNDDWDWDSWVVSSVQQQPDVILPFYFNPAYNLGTNRALYDEGSIDPMSGLDHSDYLDSLIDDPKGTSRPYVGSTFTITNDSTSAYYYVNVYGVQGFGELLKKRIDSTHIQYIIREYDPWGWCTYNWTVIVNNEYLRRSDIVKAINDYKGHFYNPSNNRKYNTSSSLDITNAIVCGLTATIRFCHNGDTDANGNSYYETLPCGQQNWYLPLQILKGGFATFKCVSDDGIIYWNIEDYYTE